MVLGDGGLIDGGAGAGLAELGNDPALGHRAHGGGGDEPEPRGAHADGGIVLGVGQRNEPTERLIQWCLQGGSARSVRKFDVRVATPTQHRSSCGEGVFDLLDGFDLCVPPGHPGDHPPGQPRQLQAGDGFAWTGGRLAAALEGRTHQFGQDCVNPFGLGIEIVEQQELRGAGDETAHIVDLEFEVVQPSNE